MYIYVDGGGERRRRHPVHPSRLHFPMHVLSSVTAWCERLLSNPVTHLTYTALVAVLGINFYPTPLSAGN